MGNFKMKKLVTLLSLALVLPWLSASATAAGDQGLATEAPEYTGTQSALLDKTPMRVSEITAHPSTAKALSSTLNRGSKVKAISSTSDLAGDYVLSYESYSSEYDGGDLVEISAISGTDSILIDGFLGYEVKAKVDISAMTISIPYQYLTTVSGYGDFYLIYFDTDSAAYSATTEITGTISTDGTITLTTGWGTLDTTGYYTYGFYYAGSTIEKVNGTMTYSTYSTSTKETTTTTVKVVVAQDGDTVYVKNFYDQGTTIAIQLYASKAATIARQYVYTYASYNVPAYVVGATFNDDYSACSVYYPLVCNTATDSRTISWGTWTFNFTYNNTSYFTIRGVEGKIEADFDITYPTGSSSLSLTGDGTADSPYQIASAADWNALADYMSANYAPMDGQYIKLTADIDFTDTTATALGSDGVVTFKGDLDGNGKTITISGTSSTTYSGGLITTASAGAYIHDLTVAGTYTLSQNYSGVVVGQLSKATLSNVTLSATVTASGQYNGGVVGYLYYSKLTDCTFAGTMSGAFKYSGGIVGQAYRSTVSGCVNKGEITATSTYNGGIVGYARYYTEVSNCYNDSVGTFTSAGYSGGIVGYLAYYAEVANCYNYGTVSFTGQYCGGIVGAIYASSYPEINNCYNYGTVSSASTYVGGILGNGALGTIMSDCGNYGAVSYTGTTAACYAAGVVARAYPGTYTNLFNEGEVTSAVSTAQYISGVFGYLYSTSTSSAKFVITGCYNTSDLTGGYLIAGISAQTTNYSYLTMTDCYNTGNITTTSTNATTSGACGIVTYYPKGSTFTNCWNSGNITSAGGASVGGLFATRKSTSTESYPVVFSKCYNTGTVTATSTYVGGVIGNIYTGYTTVDSCYNTGNVYSAGKYVGGISGGLTNSYITVSNCWNSGSVTTDASYAGGILGYNNIVNNDSIINCYNTGAVSTTATDATVGYDIGGIIGYSGSVFVNTYNAGTVSGADYVGGIVGCPLDGYTVISSAYTTGNVVALNDSTTYGYITSNVSDAVLTDTYYLASIASDSAQSDSVSVAKTYAELAAIDLGTSWTAGDNYTYPRLATVADYDNAKTYAAAVVPAEGDSYSSITTGFNVGTPDGVTWTASSGSVEIDGNTVTFSESFSGTLTMTATCGDYSVATELTCNVVVSGIEALGEDGRTVVGEKFYTVSGAQVAEPAEDSKAVYIVVKTYDDGTTETVKEVR